MLQERLVCSRRIKKPANGRIKTITHRPQPAILFTCFASYARNVRSFYLKSVAGKPLVCLKSFLRILLGLLEQLPGDVGECPRKGRYLTSPIMKSLYDAVGSLESSTNGFLPSSFSTGLYL